MALPGTASYYISLYFQDNRTPSPYSWRVFNVSLNGRNFYTDLNVTTNGVTVYATQWPLSGQTEIVMTPADGIPVGPVINAGEIFQILPLGGRTLARDGCLLKPTSIHYAPPPYILLTVNVSPFFNHLFNILQCWRWKILQETWTIHLPIGAVILACLQRIHGLGLHVLRENCPALSVCKFT